MKKVLALVLAVIMVCTMAMAIAVSPVVTAPSGAAPAVTYEGLMQAVPGESIYFTRHELGLDAKYYYDAKDATKEFVPSKNYVEVTFGKGAELVASQGWVKAKIGSTTDYYYVINLKANDTAVVDGVEDIIITKVVSKMYGQKDPVKSFTLAKAYDGSGDPTLKGVMTYVFTTTTDFSLQDADKTGYSNLSFLKNGKAGTTMFISVFDYGWNAGSDIVAGTTGAFGAAKSLSKIVKDPADKTKTAANFTLSVNNGVMEDEMKIGEKVLFNEVPDYALSKKVADEAVAKEADLADIVVNGTLVPNTVVTISLNGQAEGTKMYMVNADGSLKDLGAKFDANGVLVATAKVTGPVITSSVALTATAASSTGTTTNPGTGANDVVGVAAALAVVALVSGAAISLKK